MEDNVRKRMHIYVCVYVCVCVCVCVCDWVSLLYSRKLTEHCKPTITEKIKIIIKKAGSRGCNTNTGIFPFLV